MRRHEPKTKKGTEIEPKSNRNRIRIEPNQSEHSNIGNKPNTRNETTQNESSGTEPKRAERNRTQPKCATKSLKDTTHAKGKETHRTEPNQTEPNRTEPNHRTEPNIIEPNRTKPSQNRTKKQRKTIGKKTRQK